MRRRTWRREEAKNKHRLVPKDSPSRRKDDGRDGEGRVYSEVAKKRLEQEEEAKEAGRRLGRRRRRWRRWWKGMRWKGARARKADKRRSVTIACRLEKQTYSPWPSRVQSVQKATAGNVTWNNMPRCSCPHSRSPAWSNHHITTCTNTNIFLLREQAESCRCGSQPELKSKSIGCYPSRAMIIRHQLCKKRNPPLGKGQTRVFDIVNLLWCRFVRMI